MVNLKNTFLLKPNQNILVKNIEFLNFKLIILILLKLILLRKVINIFFGGPNDEMDVQKSSIHSFFKKFVFF